MAKRRDVHLVTGVKEVEPRHRFDTERLEALLARELDEFEPPLRVRQFRGGQSNPTYELSDAKHRWVLRRKPPGMLLPSAHAVDLHSREVTAYVRKSKAILTAPRRPASDAWRSACLYCDSRYVVEPNIKDGKGGLRDLHTLFWIAKYVYRIDDVSDLVSLGVLDLSEARMFAQAQKRLWAIRCHLHYLTGRPEERLTFDVQPVIAERLGYTDRGGAVAVERFMKHY